MGLGRKGSAFFGAAAAASVMFGVAAFACAALATLNVGGDTGKAGDLVNVAGSSFRGAGGDAPANPVQIHWNGADGPVVATAEPDSAGNISTSFTVPESQPGYYVLVATQKDAKGADVYGTPARASFRVLGPDGQSAVPRAGDQGTSPESSGRSPTAVPAVTAVLGALGLAVFGAGFLTFVREVRGRAPGLARVRRD